MSRKQLPEKFKDSGLTADGRIPKNTHCPFVSRCGLSNNRCPKDAYTYTHDYSCGSSRAFAISDANET